MEFWEGDKTHMPATYAAAAVNSTLPTPSVPGQFPLTAPPSSSSSSSTATATSSSSSTATAAGAPTSTTTTAAWASSLATASPSRASATATAYDRRVTEVSQNEEMSNYQNVDTGGESDDQEDFDDVHLEVRQDEIQKMLTCGKVSQPLYEKL